MTDKIPKLNLLDASELFHSYIQIYRMLKTYTHTQSRIALICDIRLMISEFEKKIRGGSSSRGCVMKFYSNWDAHAQRQGKCVRGCES